MAHSLKVNCLEWIKNNFNMGIYKECLTSFSIGLLFVKVDVSIHWKVSVGAAKLSCHSRSALSIIGLLLQLLKKTVVLSWFYPTFVPGPSLSAT